MKTKKIKRWMQKGIDIIESFQREVSKDQNQQQCMFYNKMKRSNSSIQSILLSISLSKSGTPSPNISLNPNHNSV